MPIHNMHNIVLNPEAETFDFKKFRFLSEANLRMMEHPESYVLEYMRDEIIKWVEYGIVPGSFLQAVLQNDLKQAYAKADTNNGRLLRELVTWFWNNAPIQCWGRKEVIDEWPKFIRKGVKGE